MITKSVLRFSASATFCWRAFFTWLVICSWMFSGIISDTIFGAPFVAYAQDRQDSLRLLGEFNDWTALATIEEGEKTCWIVSKPIKSRPNNLNRDSTYMFVTHRNSTGEKDEVSIIIGYPFKENSLVEVRIADRRFDMSTQATGAWFETNAQDKQVIAAMKRGRTATIIGRSRRGNTTTDTYSLIGFTKAYNAMAVFCDAK